MGDFVRELFRADLYKRTQGKVTRQATFFAIVVVVLYGLWRFTETTTWILPMSWGVSQATIQYHGAIVLGIAIFTGALAVWMAFRLVNYPVFGDFLIAVEAEMNKVSWPTKSELYRSSLIVLITIFLLAGALLLFDIFWLWLFSLLGVTP